MQETGNNIQDGREVNVERQDDLAEIKSHL